MRAFRSHILFALLVPVLALGGVSSASAHAHLTSAAPAPNAILHVAPQELRLKFSEGLEGRFSTVKLSAAGQAAVPVGKPALDSKDGTLLVLPIEGPLAPGTYRVDWYAVSTDTHRTQGSYSFTFKP